MSWNSLTLICSNMVKYFEVIFAFDSNLGLQTARTRIIYGEHAGAATAFPMQVYTAAARNIVTYY